MLRSLSVMNLAVIEAAEFELDSRLTILTGETGAGKSVLVGALQLLLGDRASSELVRAGTERARVTARFELDADDPLMQDLQELGIPVDDGTLLIRRDISADGRSRAFINDTAVTVGALRTLGEDLVDLHGQHEHQSLLQPGRHVLLLDAWAGLDEVRRRYRRELDAWKTYEAELAELRRREKELAENRELLTFQLTEIDALDPHPGETDELESEVRRLENAERIAGDLSHLITLLSEGESPLTASIAAQVRRLESLVRLDPELGETHQLIEDARLALEEAEHAARRYRDGFEFDQERCDRLRRRHADLVGLARKYGGSEAALLDRREQLRTVLQEGETVRADLGDRQAQLDTLRRELSETAEELSRGREAAAGRLEEAVRSELADLAMGEARFAIRRERALSADGLVRTREGERCEAGSHGIDRIEFLLATDPSARMFSLQRVASGGEVSRIMLALKSVFGRASRVPTLVFDEIDSGVGGRTADRVGEKLAALADEHQVLAITHLPQIARRGHRHLLVEKSTAADGARVEIRTLTGDARSEALAVLMSGEAGGSDALEHARRLLENSDREDGSQ